MSRINHKECLVLNADYSPLAIVSWQRSIIWYFRNQNEPNFGIEIIDFYQDDFIHSVNKNYPIPSIAKTKKFFKINSQDIKFSRKNIFVRDDHTCQYCNKRFGHNELTYDHVVPKSKWDYNFGSPTVWSNIVTCCLPCNRKKGGRTPKEANMPLKNLPFKPRKNPKYLPIAMKLATLNDSIPREWQNYIPQSYTN